MAAALAVDVHQHLWPEQLVDRLRARTPRAVPAGLDAAHARRAGVRGRPGAPRRRGGASRRTTTDGVGLACVSPLRPARHREPGPAGGRRACSRPGTRARARCPEHFRAWASVPMVDPDLDELAGLLRDGRSSACRCRPPTCSRRPRGSAPATVLRVAEEAGKPVFVHPGPELARPLAGRLPAWWAPVVGYAAQLQAAWWGWQAVGGRALFPPLRVLFARRRRAGAGAPRAARRPRR